MRIARALSIVALLGGCGAGSRASRAETIEQPRPPAESIRTLSQAEELYKAERYAEAAWVFEQIVAGRLLPAAVDTRERAEFWLGKAYFQIHDYPRSLTVFRTIAGNSLHSHHDLALAWLAALSDRLDDEAMRDRALEAMAWYPTEVIENDVFELIRDQLMFLLGAWHATRDKVELGESLLLAVPDWSDYYGAARVELGESWWRSGRDYASLPFYREAVERWAAERAAAKGRQRKQPPPRHVELAIQRLRSRGVPVGPNGELSP